MADDTPEQVAQDSFDAFFNELNEESPRAAVIVGAASLDDWLRTLLSSAMIGDAKARRSLLGDDASNDRPLSAFNTRARLAYCLGLISRREYRDLMLVAKIRNRFAHARQGYSFNEPEIVGWCTSFEMPQQLLGVSGLQPDCRKRYELAVVLLAVSLQSRAKRLEAARPTSPKEYDIAKSLRVDGSGKQG